MKRKFAIILTIIMLAFAFAGCNTLDAVEGIKTPVESETATQTDPEGNETGTPVKTEENGTIELSEEMLAVLLEMGISEETFYSYPYEKQKTILTELGYVVGGNNGGNTNGGNDNNNNKPVSPTLQDVSNGGEYIVKVSDSTGLNYMELYYKNGKLCKIYTHFQKNDLEEPEIETIEGDSAIADYSFYFIDYTASPSTVVNEIQSKIGYTSVRIRKAN